MEGVRTKTVAATALAGTAAVVAASYAGNAAVSVAAVWVVASVLVLAFAAGWPRLLDLPAPVPLSLVIGLAGWSATTLAALAPMPQPMMWMGACAAVGLILVFLTQLLRGTGQQLRLESTLAGASGVLVAVLASGWVAADRIESNAANSSMMLVSGLSLGAAVLVGTIRWPDRITAPLGLAVAMLVGGLASFVDGNLALLPAVAVGAVVGSVVVACRALLVAEGGPRGTTAAVAAGVAPVIAAGGLAYFVERILLA